MKVPYYELLNPEGFMVKNVGRVHSPRLSDINERGYMSYQFALSTLLLTPQEMFEDIAKVTGQKNPYEALSEEEKATINTFDLLSMSKESQAEMIAALAFFIDVPLEYDEAHHAVLVNKTEVDDKILIDGSITRDNWAEICDICLQTAYIDQKREENLKFKNEAARKFYERFQKKKAEYEKSKRKGHKSNPDLELGNIISALATNHNSLNYTNIYDLTVYQVHDTFNRQNIKKQNEIHDMNYAVWGGENDLGGWYKHMEADK